jgi:hypothetical protein
MGLTVIRGAGDTADVHRRRTRSPNRPSLQSVKVTIAVCQSPNVHAGGLARMRADRIGKIIKYGMQTQHHLILHQISQMMWLFWQLTVILLKLQFQ